MASESPALRRAPVPWLTLGPAPSTVMITDAFGHSREAQPVDPDAPDDRSIIYFDIDNCLCELGNSGSRTASTGPGCGALLPSTDLRAVQIRRMLVWTVS